MRQRLGVARALLGDPELLILDEPTNGLDPAGIREFRGMIRDLVAEGRTVLLSSHLLDEVEKICDAVAIVDHGRIVMQGSLAELKADRQTILIGSSDGVRVQALLAAHPAVRAAAKTPEGIRVTLRPGYSLSPEDAAADVNRFLVEAGVAVQRLEPACASLEERFLEITSRLGVAA
jgi:ABC-2 type transport system ATP-binding protein